MKIAITGGAGFIGSHLTRAYLNAGHDVLVIDTLVNGSPEAIDPRARFYPIDIRNEKLQTILQLERPDIVSHHAAPRTSTVWGDSVLADADVHIRGLLNVLESCVNASVSKFIFASGGNTLYGCVDASELQQGIAPLVKEDAPLCPQCPSDITKVAGEWYVRYYTRQHRLAHTILRYADIYGENDTALAQHPLSYFTKMLLEHSRPVIRGAAHEVRDHIFIDDVVRANLCALKRGKNSTLHVSSGQGHDLNQLYSAVAQRLHSQLSPVYVSASHIKASSIVLDNSLAQRVLGWQPEVDFNEGVRRSVELLRPATARVTPEPVFSARSLPEPENERVEQFAVAALM